MQRATSIVRKAAVKADKVIDQVSLDHEGRHRRRITLTGEKGTAFLLDLEKTATLNEVMRLSSRMARSFSSKPHRKR